MVCVAVLTVDTPSLICTDWLLIAFYFKLKHCIVIAVKKSCIHASAVAVFVEWWMVYRGICTLGAIFMPRAEPQGIL